MNSQEIIDLVKPTDVDFLYKYRSIKSKKLDRIFTHNEIFFANPTQFNDPFDCKPIVTTYKNGLKRRKFAEEVIKNQFHGLDKASLKKEAKKQKWKKAFNSQEWLDNIYHGFIQGFGIYSLSEIRDDILMWSHYTDSHRGICLEFKSSVEGSIFWEAFKVKYQTKYPKVNVMNFGDPKEFFNALAVKSEHWKYEQERRILKVPPDGPGIYKFPPQLLTGVILGAFISDPDRKHIISLTKKHPTPIKLYAARLNANKYALDIIKI